MILWGMFKQNTLVQTSSLDSLVPIDVAKRNPDNYEAALGHLQAEGIRDVKGIKGIGEFVGECTFRVNPHATPVVSPLRRVPITLRARLKEELDRMEDNNIIVKVTEPTECVNALVVVEKAKNYECVCTATRLSSSPTIHSPHLKRSPQSSREPDTSASWTPGIGIGAGTNLRAMLQRTNAVSASKRSAISATGSHVKQIREATSLTLNQMATPVPTNTSVLSGPSQSSPPSMPLSQQIGIAILVIAFVFGFPGNLFVVWSVLCRVRRRSVTCLLILNLAVADALVLLSAPLFLRYLAGGRGWEFGSAMCKTVHYLCCVNMYASIYLICLMSMDRWLAVTKPFVSQRLRTKKRLLSIMFGIWVMAFLMALPMPFYRSVWPIRPGVPIYLCKPYHWDSNAHKTFQYLSETILGFLLPYTFVLFCYISVIHRLRSAMFQRKGRGNFLILLIIAAFTVFWLPYHIINILQVIGVMQGSSSSILEAAIVARPNVTAFAFLSSSVNPVLYVFAGSSHIRQAGLGFMAKLFEGTNSESASTRSSRGSNAESSVFTKLSVKLSRKGDDRREEPPGGENETMADMHNRDEMKTLTTLH
ncbi:leukotriene B4 receptor 1-like protein [Labeo rohita]|uniref:Leukotriene B4 receptor 1-like protein n=1 Tax=Labeo rohita TaxID=84645 RepID=A0A498MV00_LABRO|nr:leukotriene B4 receptor 1-like protein [Labeo rohita]